jgi:hypothetical protein
MLSSKCVNEKVGSFFPDPKCFVDGVMRMQMLDVDAKIHTRSLSLDDRVFQHPNPIDADPHDVAGLQRKIAVGHNAGAG